MLHRSEAPVRIYLDSRDLIVLGERKSDAEYEEVRDWLNGRGHQLVISLSPILECCVPLTNPNASAVVMRTLRRIEKLPHSYISEVRIQRDELFAAITAYSTAGEYQEANPYVSRFDEVVSPLSPPATRQYVRYGLAETVFDLWTTQPDLFKQDFKHSEDLAHSRELDRSRPDHKRHDLAFPEYVRRTLAQYRIEFPPNQVEGLSKWIWSRVTRCPSFRFGYELYHHILRNLKDRAGNSDIPDLTHAGCLPYVDAMTLDRRMRNYVARADHSLGTDYATKLFADIDVLRSKA